MKKKALCMMMVAVGVVIAALQAQATPPLAIHADYDFARQELHVTVQHLVNRPKKHYINQVVVSKNSTEVAKREFDFQTSHRNQTMIPFKIPAVAGDRFEIVATCNTSGSGEAFVEVREGS